MMVTKLLFSFESLCAWFWPRPGLCRAGQSVASRECGLWDFKSRN